jgi:diadenosine tetraphosphate (Ap4A) HIT family hydrolase
MKMRLAGLGLLIGDHLHIHILPGVGLSITHFPLRFVSLDFDLS